jgi:tetratricopeptide (TPR) repeat protein
LSPPTDALSSERAATEGIIRTLEERLKRDPEDFIAANKLAGYYLQRQRETGDVNYLNLTARAVRSSLATLPAEMNKGGLAMLAEVEYANHNFAAARDHALRLVELDPAKSYSHQILGDAQLELGEYEKATEAFRRMKSLSGITVSSETRLARLAFLQGNVDAAQTHLSAALAAATNSDSPRRETLAWCQWRLGEFKFAVGDYKAAEQNYRDSLKTFPDYYRALAGLASARAAQDDLREAIEGFERVTRIVPDPVFIATLGDLYKLAGREKESEAQYRLVEQIARLNAMNGALYNRQLALFRADHDMNSEEAYAEAVKEYELRQDIYGADAVAWTALKDGKLGEAQAKMKEALRLGTKDAKLYYHAGMIARRTGNTTAARDYLKRALALNPRFDPLQSALAREALAAL